MLQRIPARKTKLVRVSMHLTITGYKCMSVLVDAVERELTYKIKPNKIHEGVTVRKEEILKLMTLVSDDLSVYYYTYCYQIDEAKAKEMLEKAVVEQFENMFHQVQKMKEKLLDSCVYTSLDETVKQ